MYSQEIGAICRKKRKDKFSVRKYTASTMIEQTKMVIKPLERSHKVKIRQTYVVDGFK